jgi:hypothetical protein
MTNKKYTAHAMEFGYLYREVGDEGRILAGMYGEEPVQLEPESALGLMAAFEEELNETEEALVNSNYPGRTTNFSELSQAGIGYSVGEPTGSSAEEKDEEEDDGLLEDVFQIETMSWVGSDGNRVTEVMNGEVRGLKQGPSMSPNQNVEPLTIKEAAELLDAINKTDISSESDRVLKASVNSLLIPELHTLLSKMLDYEEAMYNHNWNLGQYITNEDGTMSAPKVKRVDKWVGLRGLFNKNKQMSNIEESRYLDYMMSRLKLTVKNDSVGGQWAHQDRYSMGARIGITDITKELSVQNRTKQQQYCDDDFILLEKEIVDKAPLSKEVLSKYGNQLFDKDGANRGCGDKSRYFWRCSSDREHRFIKVQMYITRAPLEDLKKFFTGPDSLVYKKYTKSIKMCRGSAKNLYTRMLSSTKASSGIRFGLRRSMLSIFNKWLTGESNRKLLLLLINSSNQETAPKL